MFVGSINQHCRRFFRTNHEVFEGRAVLVGCSGNFTFEQLLTRYANPGKIISNDISLYSRVLGSWLSGQDLPLTVKEKEFHWLKDYVDSPIKKAATLVMLLRLLKFYTRKTEYAVNIWDHYLSHWDTYFNQTLEYLHKAEPHIRVDEFIPCDVEAFYKERDTADSICVSFMPTYAGGYEKLYGRIEKVLQVPSVEYEMLDDERRDKIYEDLVKKRDYIIYDDREIPGLPLVFMVHNLGVQKTVFMYSNLPFPSALIHRVRAIKKHKYKFFGPDDVITQRSRVDIVKTQILDFNYYRGLFLAKHIAKGMGDVPLLVFIDGKLFGFLLLARTRFRLCDSRIGHIVLMSDFPAPYSSYPKASKLVLLLSTTKEVQKIVQETLFQRALWINTAAFTKKPVSMKYRGIYKLVSRNKEQNIINYQAKAGTRTIKGAIKEWLKKYGQRSTS
jgi:hypothetical protein